MGCRCLLLATVSLVSSVGSPQTYDQKLVNNVGDYVLKNLKLYNPSSLSLKDKTHRFGHDVEIDTKQGKVSDFKTIRRAGDILLDFKEGGSVVVNFHFKFDDLKVRYEDYKLKLHGKVVSTGSVELAAKNNLVEIEVDMGQKSLCFLTINKLEVVTLKKFKLKFYGHDNHEVSHWKSTVMGPIIKKFTAAIKDKVQKSLKRNLPKIIKPNKYLCRDDEL